MRHLILHHHIFKNAGSTLDFTLARQFADKFAYLEHPSGPFPVTESMLIHLLEQRPELQAVSSHHIHGQVFPALQDGRYRVFHLGFVRRPMARLLSMYKFMRRTPMEIELWKLAKTLEVPAFIALWIEKHPYQFDNPQTNHYANGGFYPRAVAPWDLEVAWERYRDFSLCAPVERYDEAMVVLEYFNSPIYMPRGLDLAYRRKNVSAVLEGEGDPRTLLGPENHDWVVKMQALDEELWRRADGELQRRISLVPRFEERLESFRRRCELISE